MTRIQTPADLRAARDRHGLTQRQVADYLGVPSNTVSRLERSKTVRFYSMGAEQLGTQQLDSRWRSHLTLLFEALSRRENRK